MRERDGENGERERDRERERERESEREREFKRIRRVDECICFSLRDGEKKGGKERE